VDTHTAAANAIEQLSMVALGNFVLLWRDSEKANSAIQAYIDHRLSVDIPNGFIPKSGVNSELSKHEIAVAETMTSVFGEALVRCVDESPSFVDSALKLYTREEFWAYYSGRCCDFLAMKIRTDLYYQLYDPIKKVGVLSQPSVFCDPDKREEYENALNYICGRITQKAHELMGHELPMLDEIFGNTEGNHMQDYNDALVTGDVNVTHQQTPPGKISMEGIVGRKGVDVTASNEVAIGADFDFKKIVSSDGKVTINLGAVSAKQSNDFFAAMELFLNSSQAKELGFVKKKRIYSVIEKAKETGGGSGIKTVVEYLADISTIVINCLQGFSLVSPWVINLFR